MFDSTGLLPDTYWVTERKVVDLRTVVLEDFEFTTGDCFQMATGRCSLEDDARPNKDSGRNGFLWCRNLAIYAHAWELLCRYYGGDIPEGTTEPQPEAVQYVAANWTSPYGPVGDEPSVTVQRALDLYGAVDPPEAIAGNMDEGQLGFSDGRHRSCVACRLKIPVAVMLSTEYTRDDAQ